MKYYLFICQAKIDWIFFNEVTKKTKTKTKENKTETYLAEDDYSVLLN